MKKLIALLLAVMLLVPAFALADNVIKIGVFEPSTGDNGAGGKQEILGIEYANSLAPTVTIGGEEYTVELVIEDNQSLTDKAISAAQSLVSKDVAVVLGSYGSGVSMAGGDVFAEAGVPAIGVSCTNLLLAHLLPGSLPGHRHGELRQGTRRYQGVRADHAG